MSDPLYVPEGAPLMPDDAPTPAAPEDTRPVAKLVPGSELHKRVLDRLLERLNFSERKMSTFYGRWRMSEARMQAYIDLPEYEKLLKAMNDAHSAPKLVSVTVPYNFATIWTIVTYLAHTFTGRKPMFQVGTYKAEAANSAGHMESVLQFNADHVRLIRHLFQYFLDGEMYGVGIIRTLWSVEKKYRTRWTQVPSGGALAPNTPLIRQKIREKRTVYEGNDCRSIDPFMFFPDPRVPMTEVTRRGEFVFWRAFEGKHTLKQAETDGMLKWVDNAKKTIPAPTEGGGDSARNLLSSGDSVAGMRDGFNTKGEDFYQVDQGSVVIVPSEWGLGDSNEQEKWLFTILNKDQIVQAEPLELDHDMHPVSVIEPYSFGYGFGQIGLSDMLGPLQDTISWFVNSHIHNVRGVMNNSFVVNPQAIEMQDLKSNEPGKLIRLKPSAYGVDVRTVLSQLQVADVTQGNVRDMENFVRMGDSLAAVNDNLRGIQSQGGRKTATEVRTSGEAGASRLAAHARLISAQGVVDLTEQMSINIQQNISDEFYIEIVGQDGIINPLKITPESLVGDFYYPIHDGTLPIDKIAVLDIWREILQGVMADPELRMNYSVNKLFEFVAELGGARNITQFKVAPQEALAQQAQAGNMLPIGGGPGGVDPAMMAQLAALGGGV